MLEDYSDFCYEAVGSIALKYIDNFEGLRRQLSKANIEITLPEYVSMMFFTSAAVAVGSLLFFGLIFTLSMGLPGLVFAFVLTMILGSFSAAAFYLYPGIMMKSRASKIRDTLPFATMYLSTLAGTGTSLPEIFKNLAEVDEYGEVSKEAEKISRDIETFGMDAGEAMERAANRTPSEDFKELVWGINHVITTGGSLKQFLQQRSERLMEDYRRRVEEFSEQLSLLVEMYITVIIVGSIIFTSMTAVISSFSSSISPSLLVNIQVVAVFFGIPMISAMFIILVDGMSPGGIR
ncbi:type II secretion system F family protein [Candidatus Nanohalobium constans]|uniref:Archaeal flagellar protein FlaJ n=1 Tax=Candidatus Nanohalobium constans TaxID=2565781 RepID=A0A5Q0UF82_9ARCH|nr:type II secretion system F family protein [Candidatus Nanohalobium constans]QGA80252.1 archaeal flagellar protein FlaJ [Candidatus Nanohalobium constans]